MSIFSSLVSADNLKRPQPQNGFSKLTVSESEKAFSGNLCRCTGYRPIVDACKSFASDVDLEDLGLNIFWKKGDKKPDVSKLPSYTFGGGICTFPDFLKSELRYLQHLDDVNITTSKGSQYHPRLQNTLCGGISTFLDFLKSGLKLQRHRLNDANYTVSKEGWYHPRSIKHYYELINSTLFSECSVKVVLGNTSTGVYKDHNLYDKYIDIGGIPELSSIVRKGEGIEIGAAITISRSIEILEKESKLISPNGSVVFRKLAEHMSKVAHHLSVTLLASEET
jgi:abscisic-aldehyde oxidase